MCFLLLLSILVLKWLDWHWKFHIHLQYLYKGKVNYQMLDKCFLFWCFMCSSPTFDLELSIIYTGKLRKEDCDVHIGMYIDGFLEFYPAYFIQACSVDHQHWHSLELSTWSPGCLARKSSLKKRGPLHVH